MRNRWTIAGHGLDGDQPLIGKAEINIFVSTFANIVEIIFSLLETAPTDLMTTKLPFEAVEDQLGLGPMNRDVDTSATVEYSPEDGLIFIDGKQLRPSQILYQFDRTTYKQGIDAAENRLREPMTAQIEAELSNKRFDNFFPGHYGYDPPEIWIDTIQRDRTSFTVQGSISTSARLGASSDEDGVDIDYNSAFTAVFILDDDPESSLGQIELERLELEINDWIVPEPDEDDE